MGLETGTFVTDLVTTNPPTSDLETQGANHLQLIKTCLHNTFPDGSKAFYLPKSLSKSANYTVLNTDDNTIFYCDATGGSFTLTLPTPTNAGWNVRVIKVDATANTVTIAPPAGTISGQATVVLGTRWQWDHFEFTNGTFVCEQAVVISTGILKASGAVTFNGGVTAGGPGLTVSAGGLVVSAGGAAITGNSSVTGTLSASSTLTATSGFTVSAGPIAVPAASIATASLASDAGITLAMLSPSAKSFEAQLLYVRDEKTAGTNGGTFSSGAWRTRVLNTSVQNDIAGASLAANQITLPAGTYWIEARAPAAAVDQHKSKLRNITDTADTIIGSSNYAPSASAAGSDSFVHGRFTIGGTKVFELQHQCATSGAANGLGVASNFAVVEVYAEVMIWKVG